MNPETFVLLQVALIHIWNLLVLDVGLSLTDMSRVVERNEVPEKERHEMMTCCRSVLRHAARLQHGYALRRAVEMRGRAAAAGGLEALCGSAHPGAPASGSHDDARAVVLALLQTRHHGLAGDGAKLVGEGAVEDQDVHGEDPLADGGGVLQHEALVDEEDAA